MVTAFCRQLGWKNMEMLISQFQDRLHFGIHSELLELMRLPSLNGMRARTLFDSGFESISSIASADANTIENILLKSIPFQSEKVGEEDDCGDIRKRNKIKSIWITGYCGITTKEAAENLIAEARKYLSLEIGVAEIKWGTKFLKTDSLETTQIKDSHESSTKKIEPEYVNTSKSQLGQSDEFLSSSLPKSQIKIVEDVLEISHRKDPDSACCSYVKKNELSTTSINIVKQNDEACSSLNSSSSVTVRDEIIWDSLNYTEAGLSNMTKLRTSDKMFSPNISFGEIEEKVEAKTDSKREDMNSSKHMSTKDVSLFSSEGDNSSLFEESLPIDLINSNLLEQEPLPLRRQESDFGYASINSNTILNAFQSTLVDGNDNNEDIRLVYEDDKVIENDLTGKNNIPNEVIITQRNKKLTSSKRRKNAINEENQPVAKKKKEEYEFYSFTKTSNRKIYYQPFFHCSLSKKFTIEFHNYKMKCFVLRENDARKNLNEIRKLKYGAVYLHVKKSILVSNKIIGSTVVNITKNMKNEENLKDECPIKGIALYFGEELCIYVDITSITDHEDMEWFKYYLSSWFSGSSSIKVLCSKTVQLYLHRWLNIHQSIYSKCVDISLNEWLLDSSEKVSDVDYLVSFIRESLFVPLF